MIPEVGGSASDEPKEVSDYEVEAYELVKSRMGPAKINMDALTTKLVKWDKIANSRLDLSAQDSQGNLKNLEYRSRLCLPVVENALRALLAKYVVSLLVRRPFFKLNPIGAMDDKQAKRVEGALVFMFDKMPRFVQNIITFVQEMLIYGTGIGKVYWRKVVRNTKAGPVIEYEGAYFEPIHLENFFTDPDATGLDGYWKVHQYWTTKKALQLKNDKYKEATGENLYNNLDDIFSSYYANDEGKYTIESNMQERGIGTIDQSKLGEYAKIKIWEHWSEDNSRLTLVANESIVIYDGENPNDSGMHPFVGSVYEQSKFEFYGRGACEKVKDLHEQYQHINNQIVENVTLHNNPGYFSTIGNVTGNQILPRPGKITYVQSLDEIRDKNVMVLSEQVFRLRDEIAFKIEQALGTVAMSTSNSQPITKEQSATESAIQNRLANEYHGLNLLLLEIPCLMEIVRRAYMLLQQHAGEEYEYRTSDVSGPGFIHKEDLQDVNFSPKIGVDMMSSEVRMSTMSNLLTTLKDVPGIAPALVKELLEEAGKLLGIHFDEKLAEQQPAAEEPQPNAPAGPGPATGVPGALQPEQMGMQTPEVV